MAYSPIVEVIKKNKIVFWWAESQSLVSNTSINRDTWNTMYKRHMIFPNQPSSECTCSTYSLPNIHVYTTEEKLGPALRLILLTGHNTWLYWAWTTTFYISPKFVQTFTYLFRNTADIIRINCLNAHLRKQTTHNASQHFLEENRCMCIYI